MHIGVRVRLIVFDGADDGQRALRGGGTVQVDQRFAMHRPGEDREVAAHAFHIVAADRGPQWCSAHDSSSSRLWASCIWLARLRWTWVRSAGISMFATTSVMNAHFSSRWATSGSIPRVSR